MKFFVGTFCILLPITMISFARRDVSSGDLLGLNLLLTGMVFGVAWGFFGVVW